MNFQIGDYLVHEGSGVCQVKDIDDIELMGKGSMKTYYCMESVYKAGARVFTPLEGSSLRLRPVAAPEIFEEILAGIADIEVVQEANDRLRQEKFKEIMGEFTPESLAVVVKTALLRKWERVAEGKKTMACDEKVLNVAGKKLYEEMAFSLGKDVSEAQSLFEEELRAHCDLPI